MINVTITMPCLLLKNKAILKGLAHEMDLACETYMVSFRPIFFRYSSDFITQKVYFLRLARVYVGLLM
jgi:hypothetical protein